MPMPTRRYMLGATLAALPVLALARSGPDSFAPLVKQVLPSVVNIAVTESVAPRGPVPFLPPQLQRQFRERQQKRQVNGLGSGFIIDPTGVIVTANHVVANADSIVIILSDGTQLPAKLVGADEVTDIAVIKVEASGRLPAVAWRATVRPTGRRGRASNSAHPGWPRLGRPGRPRWGWAGADNPAVSEPPRLVALAEGEIAQWNLW